MIIEIECQFHFLRYFIITREMTKNSVYYFVAYYTTAVVNRADVGSQPQE